MTQSHTKEVMEEVLNKIAPLDLLKAYDDLDQEIAKIASNAYRHVVKDYILRIVEAALKEFVNKHDSACSHAGPCLEYLLSYLRQEGGGGEIGMYNQFPGHDYELGTHIPLCELCHIDRLHKILEPSQAMQDIMTKAWCNSCGWLSVKDGKAIHPAQDKILMDMYKNAFTTNHQP